MKQDLRTTEREKEREKTNNLRGMRHKHTHTHKEKERTIAGGWNYERAPVLAVVSLL